MSSFFLTGLRPWHSNLGSEILKASGQKSSIFAISHDSNRGAELTFSSLQTQGYWDNPAFLLVMTRVISDWSDLKRVISDSGGLLEI